MSLFKKYFIPHRENDYKPHLFRGVGLFGLFTLIIVVFTLAVGNGVIVTRTDFTALVLPKVLVDFANENRVPLKLKTLAISPVLEKAAQMKADNMASKGYFAHNTPDGHSPWYWFEKAGYDFSYAGENLAVNFSDSVDVNSAWMNSPSHKENIVNGNFNEIGIATAEGIYEGRKTVFVVQLFGRKALGQVSTISTIPKVANKTPPVSPLTTTASSSVLGTSGENDIYIAVEKTSVPNSNVVSINYSNFLQRFFSSPKKVLSIVYLIISLFIFIGLVLMLVFEIKRQQTKHVLLSLALIVLMFTLLYVYKTLLFAPLLIV